MAETCRTEIYFVLSGYSKNLANRERREKCHNKILQKCVPALKIEIGAASEMGGLLEENGIGTKDLTCIYRDLQFLGRKDSVHDGDV
jgi:hypothetical protein